MRLKRKQMKEIMVAFATRMRKGARRTKIETNTW
jgi:hypothetical protein